MDSLSNSYNQGERDSSGFSGINIMSEQSSSLGLIGGWHSSPFRPVHTCLEKEQSFKAGIGYSTDNQQNIFEGKGNQIFLEVSKKKYSDD